MNEEHVVTVRKNGTIYTVVLRAADGVKEALEELMKKRIEQEALNIKKRRACMTNYGRITNDHNGCDRFGGV